MFATQPLFAPDDCERLRGPRLAEACAIVRARHYTRSCPSGKTHAFHFRGALVFFSIPANPFTAKFLGVRIAWELSRLWAADGHGRNLLTQAIAHSVRAFRRIEPTCDALVSYADPNAGHSGTVYRAASWIYHGQSLESRRYVDTHGVSIARRAFHSGPNTMTRAEIAASGFRELRAAGKHRYVLPLTRFARRHFARTMAERAP